MLQASARHFHRGHCLPGPCATPSPVVGVAAGSRVLAGRRVGVSLAASKTPREEAAIEERVELERPRAESSNGKPLESSISERVEESSDLAKVPPSQGGPGLSQYGWLAFWVLSAGAFGAGIWAIEGPTKGQEFFAGYLLEQSLSVDNLFVFVLVFSYFKTPVSGQQKVLQYGIGTAAVLRAILIVTGVELVERCEPVLILFAAILITSSWKLLTQGDEDDESDLSDNEVVKFCQRFINSSPSYDGDKFFTELDTGVRQATPLLLTLAVVELSDVVFAVDSIPAVFGVTLDPFIVYTSNMFAILSLRAVYSFVSTIMQELRFLDKSVATVLGFIGVKMCLGFAGIKIPTDTSLVLVALTLAAGVGLSIALPQPPKKAKEIADESEE